MKILMLGKMYISRIDIDSLDLEICIDFTSDIKLAKKIKDNEVETFKNIIEGILRCSLEELNFEKSEVKNESE